MIVKNRLVLLFIPSAFFLLLHWGELINHDTAWYLIATRKWLLGDSLYSNIIEVNPPLNFYFTLPVIFISNITGLSDINSQYLFFSSLIFISTFWCWCILNKRKLYHNVKNIFLAIGIGICIVIVGIPYAVQREHLLVVFMIPWVVSEIFEGDDSKLHVILRMLYATLGICLKPHFIIYPFLLSSYYAIRKKSYQPLFSLNNIVVLVVGIFYMTYVFIVHSSYYSYILPLAKSVYGYELSLSYILKNLGAFPFLMLALISVVYLRRDFHSTMVIILFVLSSIIIYLLQWKGFNYHLLPMYFFILLCFWLGLFNTNLTSLNKVISLIFAMFISGVFITTGIYPKENTDYLVDKVNKYKSIKSILMVSTYVSIGPILSLRTNTEWASRYPTFWTIPAIANSEVDGICVKNRDKCEHLGVIVDSTLNNIFSDLEKYKPEIIIIDNRPGYIKNKEFSLRVFLNHDSRISEFLSTDYNFTSDGRFDFLIAKEVEIN